MATFNLLSQVNLSTGFSFNVWLDVNDDTTLTFTYDITNHRGEGKFRDTFTVCETEREKTISQLFSQFSSDFLKDNH